MFQYINSSNQEFLVKNKTTFRLALNPVDSCCGSPSSPAALLVLEHMDKNFIRIRFSTTEMCLVPNTSARELGTCSNRPPIYTDNENQLMNACLLIYPSTCIESIGGIERQISMMTHYFTYQTKSMGD